MVWLYVHGAIPDNMDIDHINGDRSDNRLVNLRLATASQNQQNSRLQVTSKSGFKGVHLHKQSGRWLARIKHNGVRRSLGLYKTPEEAGAAYLRASIEIFGEFAYANRPMDNNGESGESRCLC